MLTESLPSHSTTASPIPDTGTMFDADSIPTGNTATPMRRITLCVVIAALLAPASGQTLRFLRTDPTTNPTAITATKLFGFDVLADSITSVTAVSFELRYTNAQYVRLAAWKPRQLSQHSVYVIDLSDTATGTGSIHIAALSGIAATEQGMNSPTVLHLDFVVLPHAPHRLQVQFDAVNVEAVIGGPVPQIVPLRAIPAIMQVHGFVNVYPGDANNDGRVDQRDFSTVALYLGQGSSGQFRGYPRWPASTLWQPQRVLAWEQEQATFADCDGSGDITLADALVVKMNFDSTHSGAQILPNHEQQVLIPRSPASTPFTIAIGECSVSAVALEFSMPDPRTDVGIVSLDTTWKVDFFHYDTTSAAAWCVLSSHQPIDTPHLKLQLVAQAPIYLSLPSLQNGFVLRHRDKAITPFAAILSSIEQQDRQIGCPTVAVYAAAQTLHIVTTEKRIVRLYAGDGRFVDSLELTSGINSYSTGALSNGLYWLVDTSCTIPIIISP